ncbi:MAG: MoaD/ThiS family protein [Planctomycetota bacterium]
MARVRVELPSMLAALLGGARTIAAEGTTLGEALGDAFAKHPSLRVHIVDESGALRRHVLCFHNEVNSRWSEGMDRPLGEGDRITFVQAVSGG